MNKTRQKKLDKHYDSLSGILEKIQAELDAEQDYFDNLSESKQESELGEVSQAVISALENALGELESAMDSVAEARDSFDSE